MQISRRFSHKLSTIIGIAGIIAAVVVFVIAPSLAQSNPGGTALPANTITVNGTGIVRAAPDMASIELGVEVFNNDIQMAFKDSNTRQAAITEAVKATGVAAEDIITSNFSAGFGSRYTPEGTEMQGYYVNNTIRVIVRDITKIGEVINVALGAGANSLYGLSFDLADRTALESQARALAMADAESRAQEYATLIGAQLGEVVVIVESGYSINLPLPFANVERAQAGGNAVISTGQLDVQMSVQVVYSFSR
jgi:uncharacterized protein YggE